MTFVETWKIGRLVENSLCLKEVNHSTFNYLMASRVLSSNPYYILIYSRVVKHKDICTTSYHYNDKSLLKKHSKSQVFSLVVKYLPHRVTLVKTIYFRCQKEQQIDLFVAADKGFWHLQLSQMSPFSYNQVAATWGEYAFPGILSTGFIPRSWVILCFIELVSAEIHCTCCTLNANT